MGRTEDRASRRTIVATTAVLAVVAAAVVAVAIGAGRASHPDDPPRAPVPPVRPDSSVVAALASLTVLRDWDRDRASAWRAGNEEALRRLYTSGSGAGARDVAMLRRWQARGLRVRGMRMQVLGVRLGEQAADRFVLVVTDRLDDPVAVDRAGRTWPLPRDGVSTRRLEFRRTSGRWRLASAYDVTR